jgi:hypothetical protein
MIVIVSIPLSILFSLTVLSWLGETLNIMTLGGLVLEVGFNHDATVPTAASRAVSGSRSRAVVCRCCANCAGARFHIMHLIVFIRCSSCRASPATCHSDCRGRFCHSSLFRRAPKAPGSSVEGKGASQRRVAQSLPRFRAQFERLPAVRNRCLLSGASFSFPSFLSPAFPPSSCCPGWARTSSRRPKTAR